MTTNDKEHSIHFQPYRHILTLTLMVPTNAHPESHWWSMDRTDVDSKLIETAAFIFLKRLHAEIETIVLQNKTFQV